MVDYARLLLRRKNNKPTITENIQKNKNTDDKTVGGNKIDFEKLRWRLVHGIRAFRPYVRHRIK